MTLHYGDDTTTLHIFNTPSSTPVCNEVEDVNFIDTIEMNESPDDSRATPPVVSSSDIDSSSLTNLSIEEFEAVLNEDFPIGAPSVVHISPSSLDMLYAEVTQLKVANAELVQRVSELESKCSNSTKFMYAAVMAIVADFMLVWLPAPTVALRPPLSLGAGPIAKFFFNCPDNAFQIALGGTSYSLIQRLGAIARNGAKLFAVGTSASLVGTAVTNALIKARTAVDKSFEGDAEQIPVVQTSVAYGVYMAISSNLRYQILAGVVEQRVLEPLLHQHKILLSALCFAVRTGNTYLGSLLWVDYARWVGIQ
ncbi:Protein RETICULATA-RELATED 4 [Ranunculus cassubicifolius]